jgi:hypothetical protein
MTKDEANASPKDAALRLALEALEAALSDDQPYIDKSKEAITAIKAALEAKDEPVAYLPPTASPENACYTPPQRTWVGLTDSEKNKMAFIAGSDKHWLIRLVEDKLKEQNETT